MTNSKRALARLLGGASVAALSMAVLLPAAAFAQDAQATNPGGSLAPGNDSAAAPLATSAAKGSTELQTVVVTGSRIARRDYTSNSPIVTLNSQSLMSQADLQIQDTLNKLPEFTPSQNLMGGNSADVQSTPTHSLGIATLSLRGLGSNRNLVLVDSQRYAPVNASLVIDINTIPTAMIDHVEAITGGASAVYGPDAIGGVVNFIMKKNFHGMDVDLQEGINQTGDGKQFTASVVMGTNFADDKGNITVALERFNSDASVANDHAFARSGYNDPTVPGNGFFPFGTGSNMGPSQAAVNAVFPNAKPNSIPTSSYFWVNNGQLYTGLSGFGGVAPIAGAVPTVNGTTVSNINAILPGSGGSQISQIKDNETVGYIQSPSSRWSMFANGHYDINDWVTAEFQAAFAQTQVNQVLTAPASFISGWTTYVPYNQATDDPASPTYIAPGASGAQHPVPAQLATLLNSRTGGATAPWALSWLPNIDGPMPPRGSSETNTVYQIRGGLKGKFPNVAGNWTWELQGSHSESMEYTVLSGDYSLQRFQQLITTPGYGQNSTLQGNFTQPNGSGGTTASPNFGFGMGTGAKCTSGFYNTLFNNAPLSSDCLADIEAPAQSMDITTQDVVEYDMAGDLFKLPAGTVKVSLGGDYRRDATIYNPDILQTDQSFIDQVVGVYPTTYLNVSQDVKEGYGELEIPILANLPFIKSFTFNPGFRYSSYDTSAGGWTYKLLGDYEVNDWIRLRGGYNLAVRAPNLGELFLGSTENFGAGSSYGDACSLLSTAPFGAGGATSTVQGQKVAVTNVGGAAQAQSAYLICQALINKSGGAPALTAFYNTQANAQPAPGPSAFAFNLQQGNPNLIPETAHTYTAGIVLKSPFENPLISRATLSVDYYKIHIDNAIEFATIDYVYQNCLNQNATSLAQATALINNSYCQAIQRNPVSGGSATSSTPESNLATIDTSGVDVQFDWSFALADLRKDLPGRFSLSVVSSFLGNYDTIAFPGAQAQHWYGTLGPNLAGTDPGAYSYRVNTSFGYTVGPATINLNWRHLPRVDAASSAAPGNTTLPTNAYDIFDLNTVWSLPHGLILRAGIQNLFDVQPPTTAATTATLVAGTPVTVGSSGAGTTNASFYDELGRRFYIGVKARF